MRNDWPPRNAFVIQFGPGTDLGSGRMEGRVEQVASLRSARFASLTELLAFLQEALAGDEESKSAENRES